MHIEKQHKESGNYYYLVENIRLPNNRWKKVRIYLGKNLSKRLVRVVLIGLIEHILFVIVEISQLTFYGILYTFPLIITPFIGLSITLRQVIGC